jgi:hypothetical protein
LKQSWLIILVDGGRQERAALDAMLPASIKVPTPGYARFELTHRLSICITQEEAA